MTEHIRIGAVDPFVQYWADGSQRTFPYAFPIFTAADLEVWIDDAITGGFTVSGAGQSLGGTVTFEAPPPAGSRITLRRRLTIQRTTDHQADGLIRAKTLNDELDYQVAVAQQLAEEVGRAVKRSPTSPSTAALTLPEPQAGRALKWAADGQSLTNSAYDPDAQAAAAITSAQAAAGSAATATTKAGEASASAAIATAQAAAAAASAAIAASAAGEVRSYVFAADGIGTDFGPLGVDPGTKANLLVFTGAGYQQQSAWELSADRRTVHFSAPPPPGPVEVLVRWLHPIGTPSDGTVTGAKLADSLDLTGKSLTGLSRLFVGSGTQAADTTFEVRKDNAAETIAKVVNHSIGPGVTARWDQAVGSPAAYALIILADQNGSPTWNFNVGAGVTATNHRSPVHSFRNTAGHEQFRITTYEMATDYLAANGGIGDVRLWCDGASANVTMRYRAKGNAGHVFQNGTGDHFAIQPASDGNAHVQVRSAALTAAPTITTSNGDLLLTSATGTVRFGTWSASADAPITGYITVKDAAGNTRKLATIA